MSTTRGSHWSLTINNPTPADHEEIALARQKGWKVTGQEELGKEGTPHLQLHVTTPQVRFSAVKKTFSRAHIELARNPLALEAYVNKDDTRVGALPSSQERYPSLSKFWHLVVKELDRRNWVHCDGENWWREAYDDLRYPRPPDYDDDARPHNTEMQREFAMLVFDAVVESLIFYGYHVDQFYSPPNMNLWKKFHFAIVARARDEISAQTARQTDTDARSDASPDLPADEHNHAVCPSSQVSPPPEVVHPPSGRRIIKAHVPQDPPPPSRDP